MKVLSLLNTLWTRVKIIILAALVVSITAQAQSKAFTVHITIDGKSFAQVRSGHLFLFANSRTELDP